MKKKPARPSTAVKSKTLLGVNADELNAFIVHAILYVLVNVSLFIYFYSNSQDLSLLFWIIIGWGVGLVAHAMAVFGVMKFLSKEW